MKWFVAIPLLLTAFVVAGPGSPAVAESPGRAAPPPAPPAPELGFHQSMPAEQRGSREQEFYPGPVRSRHEPAFVAPLVATVPTSRSSGMRVGLSGWTAPALPFDIPQATGGVAFGLTIVWGVPLADRKEPEPESPPTQR